MIPLLLDMGLPRRAAADLRAVGWDVVHVGERGLMTTPDNELIKLAQAEGRVVVTLDSDFPTIVALDDGHTPSIIHIRRSDMNRSRTVELLKAVVPQIIDDLRNGCVAVITVGGIRVRQLPLRPARRRER